VVGDRSRVPGPPRGAAARVWSTDRVLTRVAVGRARVVREIRAAAPLLADLAVPVTARGPWLTAALDLPPRGPARSGTVRAVVVEQHPQGRPDGLALLSVRRRGPVTAVHLLGGGPGTGPLPEGRPTARLPARDDDVAAALARGVLDLLSTVRGPWTLQLSGLPMGDPTLRHLGALLTAARVPAGHATDRSRVLVDELDAVGEVHRSRDPRELDHRLPALLARLPAGDRRFARTAARVHAALGELELAVVPGAVAGQPAAALLSFVQGADRWPWWGFSDVGGLRTERGAPRVSLSASAGLRVDLTGRLWQLAGRWR